MKKQTSKTLDLVLAGKPVEPSAIRNRQREKVRMFAQQYSNGLQKKLK
jgi:hypothetical protein